MRRRRACGAVLGVAGALAGCVSLTVGEDGAPAQQLALRDAGSAPPRRAAPLVDALLIQGLAGDAIVDTSSIAYSRRDGAFAYYQLATWTDRPLRSLPRLLQQRLEARGTAAAAGLWGDPMHADWLLTLTIEALHHDAATEPGAARLAVVAQLYDRRARTRAARRRFDATVPLERADAAAAAAAMAVAVGQVFDALVPWLEQALAPHGAAPAA